MNDESEIDVTRSLEAGRQSFLGVDLLCGPGALVPRPETELLGHTAIEKVQAAGEGARVVDVCCGAGTWTAMAQARLPAPQQTSTCRRRASGRPT